MNGDLLVTSRVGEGLDVHPDSTALVLTSRLRAVRDAVSRFQK